MVDVIVSEKGIKIYLVVHGEPVAQGRPRFSARGGFVKAYDPEKSAGYKELIKAYTKEVFEKVPDFKPFDSAIAVRVEVFRGIPKSFSKKARREALEGILRPVSRPDADNYLKGVLDAVNGILWTDDALIVDLSCHKFFSDNPRLEVLITQHHK